MFEFITVVGALLGFIGGQQQASALKKAEQRERAAAVESRRIADRNAARIEAETAETVRREKLAREQERGLALAKAAARGGAISGSTELYLEEMESNDESYLQWLEKSGASQAAIARQEGNYSFLTGMAGADATRGQSVSAKFGSYQSLLSGAEAGYSWYKSSKDT